MIFVTGGTGLIGSHILLKLLQEGKEVVALKRESSSLSECEKIFKKYHELELFNKIIWCNGDINNIISLEEAMRNCTYVIHSAGLVSYHSSDKKLLYKVNVEGTANVINIALSLKIKKIVYISSIATLSEGSNSIEEITEEKYTTPNSNSTNYAFTKYYAEQEVWRGIAEGLDAVILNPSVVLGPGDWNRGSSQIFKAVHNESRFFPIGGTGYVDVHDVALYTSKVLFSNVKNERFILNSANLTYKELFSLIACHMKKPKPAISLSPFLMEVICRVDAFASFFLRRKPTLTRDFAKISSRIKSYSSKKILTKLNFKFIKIEETVKNYSNWYLDDLN